MRSLLLAGIATWLAAYTPEQSRVYDVQIDAGFSPVAQMRIASAVAAWRHAVPALVVPRTTVAAPCDPSPTTYRGHPLICAVLAGDGALPENIVGLTQPCGAYGARILLPESTTKADAAHELGHAMGLGHSKRCGTVMYPYRSGPGGVPCDAAEPTADDVVAWHAVAR